MQPTPAAENRRRQDVQGLRAIAVLVVVAFHAGLPVPGGFVGVDIFFVISGFVIISLLFGEVAATNKLSFAVFFTRRVRRILPALSLVTTLAVVGAWMWLSPLGTQQVTATTAIGSSFSVANWVLRAQTGDYFDEAAEINPLLHTWSLSVEEQFYLVFPALMLGAWALGRRAFGAGRAVVSWLLILIGVASFIGAWWFTGPLAETMKEAPLWAFYGSTFRVWEFAIGGLLAVGIRQRPHLGQRALQLIAVLGLGLITASIFLISPTTPTPGPWTAVPVLATGAVIYAGTGTSRGPVPGLASRPMVWLGDLSYSWYLWHWPMIVFTSVLTQGSSVWIFIAAFGSLLPAWLSYQMLEQPIRRSKIHGRRVVYLAVLCVAVPLVAAIALNRQADDTVDAAKELTGSTFPLEVGVRIPPDALDGLSLDQKALLAQIGQWEAYDEPCLGDRESPLNTCTFFGENKPRAVIVGDSHAGALSPGFLVAANELGFSAEVITSPGCPFTTDLILFYRGALDQKCVQRNEEILDYLTSTQPAVVVIGNRSPRFVNPEIRLADELEPGGDPACVADPTSGQCLPHDQAVSTWAASLAALFETLRGAGVEPALLQTVPENERGLLRCTKGVDVDLDCLTTPREVSWDRRVDVISAEAGLAEEAGVATFDPFDLICDDTFCYQYAMGIPRYRNDDHLSVFGSNSIVDPVKNLLARASSAG